MTLTDECEHGNDPDTCPPCQRRERMIERRARGIPRDPDERPSPHDFAAHYPGMCSGCYLDIHVGQLIHRTGPNTFAHRGC